MTLNLSTLLAVGFGGFLGAVTRFYIGLKIGKHFPHELPLATLFVNITGSFFIGILIGIFLLYTPNPLLKVFLVTGFLGALTTYSTFAIESYLLLNTHFWYGVLNISANVLGSIIAAGSGYKLISTLGSATA